MYLPKGPPKKKENPFAVRKSKSFITASITVAFFTTAAAGYMALEKVRERRRRHVDWQNSPQSTSQRVVIVGAGAAGCALAASLTNNVPDVHVTVIERERKHVFHAMVPLAHVGHRSYDLNTTGGVDFLRSPVTWNVTRDARLVRGEVIRVDPVKNEVLVREDPTSQTLSSSSSSSSSGSSGSSSSEPNAEGSPSVWKSLLSSVQKTLYPFFSFSGSQSRIVRYPYDALVLACGAERTISSLQHCGITAAHVDRYGTAVNPGITRDSLMHLFQGTVLHVKVPPASFVEGVQPKEILSAESSTKEKEKEKGKKKEKEKDTHIASLMTEKSYVPEKVQYYASRQHDGTFVSSVNTIWRYLYFFKKLALCPYIVVTADKEPSDVFPLAINDSIKNFWKSRNVNFVNCSYLTHVDTRSKEATLYNYATNETKIVPYRLLVLDLPVAAPEFIHQSGLSTKDAQGFASVDCETLQHLTHSNIFALGDCAALPTAKSYGAAFAQVPVVSHNVCQLLRAKVTGNLMSCEGSFAKYDGYSSFHIVMTTWRAMWPELVYPRTVSGVNFSSKALELTNNHIWDNLAWEDVRGFLNALYYQLFLYEVMFYFVFTRAAWHPPTWFSVPTYSEYDGIPIGVGRVPWM